jgi:glycosyltransferase involved in cell wall biosynthesis
MSVPLISVVTPSYNQSAYLDQTIRSVLAQEYPALEYIVVDGGSHDGSLEIIQRYADRLSWWVSEPDHGQAEAINKGLARARGEIVAWLNSDDLYLPGALAGAAAAFAGHPAAGFVYGDAITIDSDGRPRNRQVFPDWGLEDLLGFRIICQPAVFMRREILAKAGLLEPSYHFMLDHHLWVRLAAQAAPQHVQQTWAAARHHPGAKNVAQAPGFGRETLRMLAWMENQPELAELLARHRCKIQAGAYRLNARYLLDGGLPGPALRSYLRAFSRSPGFTLKHWHRILYALLSLAGGSRVVRRYSRQNHNRSDRAIQTVQDLPGIQGWPGIRLPGALGEHDGCDESSSARKY